MKFRSSFVAAAFLALPWISTAQTTIKFWVGSSTAEREKAVYRDLVASFNSKHPETLVKLEIVPGSETDATKLMTAVRSGAGPDVYVLDRFTVSQRAATGLLRDLTPFLKKEGKESGSDYLDFAWKEELYQDKIYGLPIGTDTRALFYNKKMLIEAGIDPQELDSAKGPITWNRLREISTKLNKADESGAYSVLGCLPWLEQGWGYTWGFAAGGEFFDFKQCKVTADAEPIAQAYQFLFDWAKTVDPQKAKTFVDTYWEWPNLNRLPEEQNPFLKGKVGLIVTGQWLVPVIQKNVPDLDYGVTYIPSPKGLKTTWSGGWSLVLPQGSKNTDAAYVFAQFVSGEESQTALAKGAALMPTLKTLAAKPDLLPPEYRFFQSLLAVSRSRPPIPVAAFYWDKLKEAEEAVITNSQEPKAVLGTLTGQVQQQMNRYCHQ